MAYIFARNRTHAKSKARTMAKKISGVSVNVKVLGKPNPRFTSGKEKLFNVSIQKKNKR